MTVERIVAQVQFMSKGYDYITTLVDLYGFQDARGRTSEQLIAAILSDPRVEPIERESPGKVIPYIQRHEFEALLFSDLQGFAAIPELAGLKRIIKSLEAIRALFETPEDINNSPQTAPSKQIKRALPQGSYNKSVHGALVAQRIGIERIKVECPGFRDWLTHLEGLAT